MAKARKRAPKTEPKKKKDNGNGHHPIVSDEIQQQHFTRIYTNYSICKSRLKDATSDLNKMCKAAEKEYSITKLELEIAYKLAADDGEEKAKSLITTMLKVARWRAYPLGTQMELFTKKSEDDPLYEEGKLAAMQGDARKPPLHYSQSPRLANRWMEGWDHGNTVRNKTLQDAAADAFRPLGDVIDAAPSLSAPEQHAH
jgi:hypothetical protein